MTAPLPRPGPHADVMAEVAEAAARMEVEGTVPADFLARVRTMARRLGAAEVAPDDIRGAIAMAQGLVPVDVDAPTTSTRRTVVLAKRGVRRAGGWYLRHLARQVTALGEAVIRAETAVAGRLETVEQRVDELTRLRERVEKLEAAVGSDHTPASAEAEPRHGPSGGSEA